MAEVVIPWRPGCPHRERAFEWVRRKYRAKGLRVFEGLCADGPWVKSLAVRQGIERTSDEILVVADADVWCDDLNRAIQAVEDGAPWAVPHMLVHRLDEKTTQAIYGGHHPSLIAHKPLENPYKGRAGGGIVVLRRDVWDMAPLDPRFVGWGQEDDAWALALRRLVGACWRGKADLWHLWHPPQERMSRGVGSIEGRELFRRYSRAKTRDAMGALVGEVSWP